MKRKESLAAGISGALIASLCCLGPLAIILLGLGSASTALSIGYRKPYFLVLGLVFFIFGFYHYRRKNWCGRDAPSVKSQIFYLGVSFLAFLILYYLLSFVLTPFLAPMVYRWRFG